MVLSFKSLDVYRVVPKDLTEPTFTGAVTSVIAISAIVYLFAAETLDFLSVHSSSEMFVDAPRDAQRTIRINLNVTMAALPCSIVSIDAQDIMGTHVIDLDKDGGLLKKTRIRTDGSMVEYRDSDEPEKEKGEGCFVYGFLRVKKVPGNFHISCHAHTDLLELYFQDETMNVSHTIHHLSFGEEVLVDAAKGSNPLNGAVRTAIAAEDNKWGEEPVSFEYYVNIVPTLLEDVDGSVVNSYQFVANSNEVNGHYRVPAVYFRYDFSPITMKVIRSRTSLAHFLVQVCAIIGGVFTVMGLLNGMANSTLLHLLKKDELGKLG